MLNENFDILDKIVMSNIGLTALKARSRFAELFKKIDTPLTIDQVIVLNASRYFPDITQQEMADALYKDKSNFSRIADELEKKGLIIRKVDLKGKRAVKKITVTDSGHKEADKLVGYITRFQTLLLENISEDEISSMKATLTKIRNNLDKDYETLL